jgi:putative pyrroloquinoline-quinone binding quinoprotein
MRYRRLLSSGRAAGLALGLLGAAAPTALPSDWPQFDFDAAHSGVSLQETTINRGNVATLHVLYNVVLPSVADGAPAFLSGVATPQGVKDLLFLNTKDGRIIAVNAADGSTVWARQPATGPRYTTSSPAVDPGRLYVYAYGLDGKVHKYQMGDGVEVTTGGWPEVATLKPDVEKGSSALSVATSAAGQSYLYVANGGYPGDAGDYQGHVTAIDLATGLQKVFNANCSNQTVHFVEGGSPNCPHVQSAIWARAGVVYDARSDRILMATGNGTYDGNTGHFDWGDTVFALHPDGTGNGAGQPLDTYTPTEFQQLQNADADLGSMAPAILPVLAGSKVAHLAVQSGKDAKVRLLDLDDLSGAGGPGHVGGELQKIGVPQGGGVLTTPAVWSNPADGKVWVIIANGNGISGLQASVDGSGNPLLASRWTDATGGTSPMVANGILYYASHSGLRALDPATGALLWSDASIGGIHWESPIVVDGRVYVTDEAARLWAYALHPIPPADFYTVAPCRLVDTRGPNGPFGGPALQGGGARRLFAVAGRCGVPTGAVAVALNVTVVSPSGPGNLRVGPAGVHLSTSTINFAAGQTRANNAVVGLTGYPLGSLWVQTDIFAGTTHLVLDVAGYFQ